MSVALDLIGQQLGDYIIERQIAIGGMATIYLGQDVKLGRNAAIKVLLPEIAGRDETLTGRFEREARAIAQLEHDNIIPIYQFGQQDNLYFLAMRYVEGDDLGSLLTNYHNHKQLIPMPRALRILEQVAAALDHAHSRGIVHRDVKPSNVLITASDRVYLSDFGLVLYSSGDQTLGTAFGTPRYISPEQATDSTLATGQSDIYSLAVIVYEMVTGQRLFRGNTPIEIAISHIKDAPQPPRALNPAVTPEMQRVILRSLEKDPHLRHASATSFIEELRAAYQASQIVPFTPSDSTEHDPVSFDDTRVLETPRTPVAVAPPLRPMTHTIGATPLMAEVPPAFRRSPPDAPAEPSLAYRRVPWPLTATVVSVGLGIALVLVLLGAGWLTRVTGEAALPPDATAPQEATPALIVGGAALTIPTTTPRLSVTATPVNGIVLRYTPDLLALINMGDASKDIRALVFRGRSAVDQFVNSEATLGDTLPGDTCLLIFLSGRAASVPPAWPCLGSRSIVINPEQVFWRADSPDDQTFHVLLDAPLATCQTVGRAVARLDELMCQLD